MSAPVLSTGADMHKARSTIKEWDFVARGTEISWVMDKQEKQSKDSGSRAILPG
jgi:hypothetical protein